MRAPPGIVNPSHHTRIVALSRRSIITHRHNRLADDRVAEYALGSPEALRRSPFQSATGTAFRLINVPATLSARGLDRAIGTVRATADRIGAIVSRGTHSTPAATRHSSPPKR